MSEDRAKERNLTRIATRGVTQLFNAVAERQKLVDKKLEELQKTKQRSKRQKVVDDLKSNDFFANLHTRKQKIKVSSFLDNYSTEYSTLQLVLSVRKKTFNLCAARYLLGFAGRKPKFCFVCSLYESIRLADILFGLFMC